MDHWRNLTLWCRERFKARRYVPLAFVLSGPALGFFPDWPMIWALLLLLQARLADDFFSREKDRALHPDRRPIPDALGKLCVALILINATPLFGLNALASVSYTAFLLLQWPRLPASLKYAALAVLIDSSVPIASPLILVHGFVVAFAAIVFELGHDPLPSCGLRLSYALGLIPLLLFMPWLPAAGALLSFFFIVLGFLRLWPPMEFSAHGRWLYSSSAHVGAAVIAASLFHPLFP
ncbi:MAG TPA: hypothetical protein VE954_35835 [Oligoflexus sp.]|uniref:hypothetical protein n=1 Tax=Oligoflexus sp. TaxID=1971216 RepID=UPI002D38B24D|nr:hypothetical protein [Oligoflexus sp.]HYX38504.1 hypothetical protein [Oligoflexus sp.]